MHSSSWRPELQLFAINSGTESELGWGDAEDERWEEIIEFIDLFDFLEDESPFRAQRMNERIYIPEPRLRTIQKSLNARMDVLMNAARKRKYRGSRQLLQLGCDSCSAIYIIAEFVFLQCEAHTSGAALCLHKLVWLGRDQEISARVQARHRHGYLLWQQSVWETYVLVFEETQHFQFPEHTFRRNQRLEHVRELLERHSSAVSRICHCPVGEKRGEKCKIN